MIKNTKKGYFTLEAAIFLPIFIIGILTLGYYIKILSTAENITYAMIDETKRLASEAYGIKAAPQFPAQLEKRIRLENRGVSQIEINNFWYLYQDGKRNAVISLKANYRIEVKLPLALYDGIDLESSIKCRGFVGSKYKGTPMSFDEMERNGESDIVWVFPMWGKKYHGETCSFIKANAIQKVLTAEIKKEYRPCELCDSKNLPIGTFVYCFFKTGEVYHKGSCKTIEKYAVEIEKAEAVNQGYTPCSKCGGK